MKKNEFDNVLHQIRTVTKKYGNDDVLVYRKDITTVVISNKLWVYKVECSVGALIQLTKVGFFMFDDRDEYNDFLAQKNDTIELKLNITLLIDKYNVKKMTAILPNVLLIGGIITLLISL